MLNAIAISRLVVPRAANHAADAETIRHRGLDAMRHGGEPLWQDGGLEGTAESAPCGPASKRLANVALNS